MPSYEKLDGVTGDTEAEEDRAKDGALSKGATTSLHTPSSDTPPGYETIPHPDAKHSLNNDSLESKDVVPPKLCFPVRYQLVYLRLLCSIPYVAILKCLNVTLLVMVTHQPSTLTDATKSALENGSSLNGSVAFSANQTTDSVDSTTDGQLTSQEDFGPRYPWSDMEQSLLLGAYFVGMFVMQLPSAVLVRHVGPRALQTAGYLLSGVLTILLPLAAASGVYVAMATRLLLGVVQASYQTSHNAWLAWWAPAGERGLVMALTGVGLVLGVVAGKLGSALLIDAPAPLGGWPTVFYTWGALSLMAGVAWGCLASDTPADHPRITTQELTYIENTVGDTSDKIAATYTLSWKLALKSRAVWALIASVFACQWNDFVMPMALPGYLDEALNMAITENGFFSSLPFLLMIVATPISGFIGDRVWKTSNMSLTSLRKIFTAVGLLGPGLLLALLPVIASPVYVTALFMLAITLATTTVVGCRLNHLDLAPRAAGELFGLVNAVAVLAGVLGPLALAGAKMLSPSPREQWAAFFGMSAFVYALGGLAFLLGGRADPQPLAVAQADPTPYLHMR